MNKLLLLLSCVYCISPTFAQTDTLAIKKQLTVLIDSSNYSYERGEHMKSLNFNIQIVENAQKINDIYHLYQGYRFIGYDYIALNDSLLAKEHFEKSQAYARQLKNDTAVAKGYMDLANLQGTFKGDFDKAKWYHDQSITIFERIQDSAGLSSAYYNTLLTLSEYERYEYMLPYLEALEKYKAFGDNALPAGLKNQWAKYYTYQKKYDKAHQFLEANLRETSMDKTPLEIEYAYDSYSQSLYQQGKYKEAFEKRLLYEEVAKENVKTQQKLEFEKISDEFQAAELKKTLEQEALRNQLQTAQVASQTKLNDLLIVIIVFCLLLLFVSLWFTQKRKQYVKRLKVQNEKYLLAKEESERISKSKTSFFSTVSHELRTPLYGVIGLSTILMEDPKLKSHEQDIKSLKFSADYLLALINDVLQINKIDANTTKDEIEIFAVKDLIHAITNSFEYMRLQNKNTMKVVLDPQLPDYVKGNSMRLSQVLMNLIGNAFKFTENGQVTIRAQVIDRTAKGTQVSFSIDDTGIGIPKERQHLIFDEFSQIGSKHYSYQGTGLGLPIVKKLLALDQSNIYLESEFGKGSHFQFTLTFEDVAADEELPKCAVISDRRVLEGKKILIVDDNRINQKVTQRMLERVAVRCTIVDDGAKAVAIARETYFDLILMDINMPVLNGIDAAKAIRTFNTTVPILALTAVEIKEMRTQIYEAGMDDIIVKPYDINKFEQTIIKNLNRQLIKHSSAV